jgi:hypothetical protein
LRLGGGSLLEEFFYHVMGVVLFLLGPLRSCYRLGLTLLELHYLVVDDLSAVLVAWIALWVEGLLDRCDC